MRSFIRNGMCCLLAALMTLDPMIIQYLSTPDVRAAEAAQLDSGAGKKSNDPSPEDLKRMADEMERGFKALEAAEREIPRDTFDLNAIVDKVGKDPVKLFEWVRDNTYWVPYRGALRGHTGVLMDRLGSSLDRSLLLAELLRVAGHKVRLARAELTEDQAKAFLPKLRPVPKEPLPTAKQDSQEFIKKYAQEFQLNATILQKRSETAALRTAKAAEELAQRVAEQAPAIAKAVGKPSQNDIEAASAGQAIAQLVAVRDHWWVQRWEDKAWVNLDPLLPDSEAGRALTEIKETVIPDPKTGRFTLDSEDCHEVHIRIVIEQWKKDRINPKTVLTHVIRPADHFGERVALHHIPLGWPKDLKLTDKKDAVLRLRKAELAQTEWLPVLTVGSRKLSELGFRDSGDVFDGAVEQMAAAWGLTKVGDSIGGILTKGTIGKVGSGIRPPAQGSVDGILTAEWIEYEIRSPGQKPRTVRRQIFDLVGPAARGDGKGTVAEPPSGETVRLDRALNLTGQSELLPLVCQLSPEFVEHLLARNLLANRQVLIASLRLRDSADATQIVEQFSKFTPLPGRLYSLALMRKVWSRFRGDFYLDSPNILSYHTRLELSSQGELLKCNAFDIVVNEVAVRPGSGMDAFQVRLEQGTLETNAEALLMRQCARPENTAEIFAAANAQGVNWLTIRNVSDPAWKDLKLADDVRARIQQDLKAGYTVLVPQKAAMLDGRTVVGWWRVHPQTGHTLGIGETGWGHATEHSLVHSVIVEGIVTAVMFAICEVVHNSAGNSKCETMVCLFAAAAEATVGLLTHSLSAGLLAGLLTEGLFDCHPDEPHGPHSLP